jgi:hypothetical protein
MTPIEVVIMVKKSLLYVLGALMFILWAGQPAQSQSPSGISLKKKTCGDLWPVAQNNKWGYIDKTGGLIIPFEFDDAGYFSEGLASVLIGEKSGYIDKTGKFVIPPQPYSGYPFSEGLAVVVLGPFEQKGGGLLYKHGYIDRLGKMVIQPREAESIKWLSYYSKALAFSEGLAAMFQKDKFGFIDKFGRQIIPPQYKDVQHFSEGLAAVALEEKYGYIDRSGKMVIPPKFWSAGSFSGGLAVVQLDSAGNKWGYIDKSGKLVINGEGLDMARGFSEGLAAARAKNGKYGYIDKTGNFVIPPQFYRVGDFSDGLAAVEPVPDSWPGNLNYINQKGQIVITSMSTFPDMTDKVEFDLHNYRFCGGIATVGLGKKETGPFYELEGYINTEGKFIWPAVAPSKKESR